ncbi:glycyl-tRNA synthetase [Diaminobutyricimonas aerilata]|uniref:glycyl-tRNA synthetase n=1 Tax=Diaminobutyricimonas aerilata TaxID=1162967 RepID=UPI0012FE5156|nr:glycyl-tRNA synthetase [Diaminobutyricimonas aerilata]
MGIGEWVAELGGMAQKQQLIRRGAGDRHLTSAVRRGEVVRVRNGWYTTLPPQDPRVRAVRVGGRLTGISAVAAWGGWVERTGVLHVALPVNAARSRSPVNRRRRFAPGRDGVRRHWEEHARSTRGDSMFVDIRDALRRVALDEPIDVAVAAFDWALHSGRLERSDIDGLIEELPARAQVLRELVDGRRESLPESLVCTRAQLAGHRVRAQVRITDTLQRIDVVVDDIVAVEVDGKEHHLLAFERDREKDLAITRDGYHPLRPTARLVFDRWPEVLAAIRAAIAARRSGAGVGNSGLRGGPVGPRPGIAALSPLPPPTGARNS